MGKNTNSIYDTGKIILSEDYKKYMVQNNNIDLITRYIDLFEGKDKNIKTPKIMNRISPDNITELKENEIFVFGSNLSGFHGAGAAKMAYDNFGAEWENPNGLQGQSYAIPTKSEFITRTLTIKEIKPYVDEFIEFAKENKDLTFLVTEIGCGLAGLKVKDVAPLFKNAGGLSNIHLPYNFWEEFRYSEWFELSDNVTIDSEIMEKLTEYSKIIGNKPPKKNRF